MYRASHVWQKSGLCGTRAALLRFRQALAVVTDITDPDDADELKGLNLMRCQAGTPFSILFVFERWTVEQTIAFSSLLSKVCLDNCTC